MNFSEAVELLLAFSEAHLKSALANSWIRPKIVFDNVGTKDYTIVCKEELLELDCLSSLEEIAETHQYRIRKHNGYLSINSS